MSPLLGSANITGGVEEFKKHWDKERDDDEEGLPANPSHSAADNKPSIAKGLGRPCFYGRTGDQVSVILQTPILNTILLHTTSRCGQSIH